MKMKTKENKEAKKKRKPPTEQDSMWKEMLDTYFPDFLKFFFKVIYDDIDFTKKPEFLDKEFLRNVERQSSPVMEDKTFYRG